MEKVWRPLLVWERSPVTSLNGSASGCFRKKLAVFVNKCKTGNSIPPQAAALWRAMLSCIGKQNVNSIKNRNIGIDTKNWHTLRLLLCKTAI
ncbi:MAG: hypothetical protein ACX936_02985 [Marinobacter sp.]